MDKIEYYFNYKKLDMILIINDYSVSEDGDVNITDYHITLDYYITAWSPHPADEAMTMIDAMLNDGDHLQEVIMYAMSKSDRENIKDKLRREWSSFWNDFSRCHEVACDA